MPELHWLSCKNIACHLEKPRFKSWQSLDLFLFPVKKFLHNVYAHMLWCTSEGSVFSSQVTVNITDINDNRPLFSESSYETAVVENTTTGETVLVVRATDSDSGSNGEITYDFQSPISKWWPITLHLLFPCPSSLLIRVLSSSPPAGVFSIDGRTGVITVSGTLDAETVPR